MKRRQFIKNMAMSATGLSLVSSQAFSQTMEEKKLPDIKWRMVSSFPKNLDILFSGATLLAERISAITQGRFKIEVFSAGELVPATQVFDAIQEGTVEIGHTASYYYHGKNKAFSIDTTLPFGMTARMRSAWIYEGGGLELLREMFAPYNIVNFPAGNTGTQMGGWFRKEIKTLDDLKGLKFRIPGFGAEILSRLGVIPQNIPASDIYSALEKGAIDATEFVGPYDDEKLGFQSVAPFYYCPGFWEGSAGVSFYINKAQWENLPREYQMLIETVSMEVNTLIGARYDAKNPRALATLIKNGAKLRQFPRTILEESYTAAHAIYDEESNKNPVFKKIYDHWKDFRHQEYQWIKINEGLFQNFVTTQISKNKKKNNNS